jgi:cellulose synthase/poly-beta-1,6-N-acetylglucosamine synthase-like glycosyltransferase
LPFSSPIEQHRLHIPAKGEFIVCIDADTLLDSDALQYLLKHFSDPEIAAVAGNVKVGNRRGVLTKLQALEYLVRINLYRRSEANLKKVINVPGPIGAFRTSVLREIGLFEGDTFAEDADIAVKELRLKGESKKKTVKNLVL